MVGRAAAEGRRFARVRVVTIPMTDYSRWGYVISQHNNSAGEDIRYLTREQARAVRLPDHDYWLFDSRKLVRMNFSGDDRFLTAEIIEDAGQIVQHNYWRDVAWHYAVRREDFDVR